MSDNKIKGRPRKGGSHTVHDALLEAARSCLEEKAYHAITIRELAHRAHTNSAMINYYFGSKGNLFVQLVEVMFEDFHQLFQTLNNGPLETSRSPNTALVNALIPFYSKWLNVLRLFSSEAVLYNTNMRAAYKTRLAKGMYLDVRDYLKQMVRRGVYRPDLAINPQAAVLANIMSNPLHFHPFLAACSSQAVYDGTTIRPENLRLAFIGFFDQLLPPAKSSP